ncbi:MAG: copper chaperone PCu(A)C [Neptuniibacter sp.]
MSNFLKRTAAAFTLLCLSAFAQAEITIETPYVRAVPPGQMNSAAFMQLNNSGSEQVALISASSSIAKNVELHNHINADGVMKMRQVDKVNIAANGTASLQPGGYHIMLIGLNQDLTEGQEIDLKLQFSDGSEQALTIPVQKVMTGMKNHNHGHHHH